MPYLRVSGFYFFYFALLGALIPYWSLYLESLHFDAQTIGLLMATLHISRIFAPNLWGWIADHTGQRVKVVQFGALMAWIVFIAIFWQGTALGVGLTMLAFSFFWNAVLPQFEVLTLKLLGKDKAKYSHIRLWGSVGFIFAVLMIGALLEVVEIGVLPWILLMIMLLIWLNSLLIKPVKEVTVADLHDTRSMRHIIFIPQVQVFFLIFFLIQLGHGPYYTFYSLMMLDLGYSSAQVGWLWAVGVLAEVALFWMMPWIFKHFSLRRVMLISLALCVLRWMLIGLFSQQYWLMMLSQLLHAATFGSLHAVGIALVSHYFSPSTQGRGQALFSSAGFGAGGAAGAILSGVLWGVMGSATFYIAALVSLLGLGLAWVWIRPEKVLKLDS